MKLTFYGGAQSVTGSNYMIESGNVRILIDCGIFQGSTEAEIRNYETFPYDPSSVTAVFISHSHADHTGRLPKLYKEGFRGTLYATEPTLEMTRIALPDNLSLMLDQAEKFGRPPLFNQADLDGILGLAKGVKYRTEIDLGSGVVAILHDAGHILGSASIEIRAEGKSIYFSGDLGNPPVPLLKHFEYPENPDYITIESAYGNRVHEDQSKRKEKLRAIVKDTIDRKGVLMIPSFAMERTQELLFELNNMNMAGEIPEVPIFLDSPLAIKLTEVYKNFPDYFNDEARQKIEAGDDVFNFPGLKYTTTSEESKKINDIPAPKIIIAGSGMSNGGRIQHHERRYLSDSNSTILFIGYQAEGTPGRQILDGTKGVKIFGELVPVNCRVEAIGGYSAHADQPKLMDWIGKGAQGGKLKKVFAVQGEVDSAAALAEKIKTELKVEALVPTPDQSVEL